MAQQPVENLVTGLSNSLNQYLGIKAQNDLDTQKSNEKNSAALNLKVAEGAIDLNKNQQTEKYKKGLEDVLTPEMAEKALPGYGAQMVQDYNSKRPDNPLSMKEGMDYIKNASDVLGKKTEKQQRSDDVRLSQYATGLRADKEFTNVRTKRDNLENMGGLLDQVEKQKDGPDRRQIMENAMGQVKVLINTGQISEKEVEHLMPNTFKGKIAAGLEFFTNKPESTDAQDFIKRSRDFFHREADITDNQLSRRMNELSAPYKHILERNEDVATETFSSYGVHHPKYNPKHNEKATAPREGFVAPKEDPLGLFK